MSRIAYSGARASADTPGRPHPLDLEGWHVVGTRPTTAYTGSGNGNVGHNGRLKDFLACDCTQIRLVYSAPLALELDGRTNTVATEAGVEPTLGGSILPATFGGRKLGLHDANGIYASDPIPGPFPKGPLWTRTFSTTLTAAVGTWATTSGSTTATVLTYGYGRGQVTVGAIIFGTGVSGFANTVTNVSTDGLTITLAVAANATQSGASFYTNAGQGQITHNGYSGAGEFGAAPTAQSPSLAQSGAITANTANSTGPALVLGRLPEGATPPECWAVVGDSNLAGTGWTATDYDSRAGTSFGTIGLGNGGGHLDYDTPYINIAKGGETGATFAALANSWRRRKLLEFCTHALVMEGTNDLGTNPSLATLQATLTSIWTFLADMGIEVWACTLPPQTTSSDVWATTGNQTKKLAAGTETVRVQINDWIRTTPTPLAGYFETADAWETSRNSGIWKVGLVYTTDGLGVHLNNAGHNAGGDVVHAGRP